MFLTILIAAHLQFIQLIGIPLQPAHLMVMAQLKQPVSQGIVLQPAHLTVVKTWN